MADAALGVARAVERREYLLAELACPLQDGAANIGSSVRETRQIVVASDPEDVIEEKQDVLDRGFVDRHGSPPSAWHRLTSESGHVSPPSGKPGRGNGDTGPHRTLCLVASGVLTACLPERQKLPGKGAGPLSMTCQTSAGIARAGGLPLQRQMRIGA